MKRIEVILLGFLLMGGSIPQTVLSNTVMIENSSGENIELGIDANDRFLDVLARIQSYFEQDALTSEEDKFKGLNDVSGFSLSNSQWNLAISHAGLTARSKEHIKRDYYAPVTREQKEDITFIVTSLAWNKPLDVWDKESELTKAGDRIAGIHPLNFLKVIFTNDKLVAGVSAIKERSVPGLKRKFFKGITKTLSEEAGKNNLLEFVDDFAEKLEIGHNSKGKLYSILEQGHYDNFVDILIELKPREGADRHNM